MLKQELILSCMSCLEKYDLMFYFIFILLFVYQIVGYQDNVNVMMNRQ
jgi:hypothetical protein